MAAHRRTAVLLFAAILSAACNPNFGMGSSAPETPADWKAPRDGDDDSGGTPGMEELVSKLEAKVKADDHDVESRKQLGLLYAETGRWDDAAKVLAEAEVVDPKNVDVKVSRAKVLMRRKDNAAALQELVAAQALAPNDESVLRAYGDYYILADQPAEAIKARKKLLAKHPDLADAESVQKQMFYLEHIPKLREAQKLKEFFNVVGTASEMQDKGRDEEAIPKFQAGLALLPDDPNLHTDLGVSLRRTGKKAEAIASFQKALSFDRDNSKARLELARAQAGGGDRKAAAATLKDWQKIDARRATQHGVEGLLAKLEKGESIDEEKAPTMASATVAPPHGGGTQGSAGFVRGTITIAPALAARIPPGAKFYVFAKSQPGGGPPLAVHVETRVPSFPYSFELSAADVMMQGLEFTGAVYLTARVDADGAAGASAGDLEGATASSIPVGTDGVQIVIDKVRGADGQLATASGAAPAPASTQAAPAPATGGAGSVSGTIDVAPSLRAKLPASATLFVFAKNNPGGGPPLAVHREPVTSSTKFPIAFSLSQGDVMMQGMTFTGPVYVTARIDVDGVAGAGPGDLEGVTRTPVTIGTQNLSVLIDTVR